MRNEIIHLELLQMNTSLGNVKELIGNIEGKVGGLETSINDIKDSRNRDKEEAQIRRKEDLETILNAIVNHANSCPNSNLIKNHIDNHTTTKQNKQWIIPVSISCIAIIISAVTLISNLT